MARLNTSEADLEIERANSIILRKRIPQENPSVFKQTLPKVATKSIETQTDQVAAVQCYQKELVIIFHLFSA